MPSYIGQKAGQPLFRTTAYALAPTPGHPRAISGLYRAVSTGLDRSLSVCLPALCPNGFAASRLVSGQSPTRPAAVLKPPWLVTVIVDSGQQSGV